MSKIELAIKFGSNEIIVYRKGFGIMARVSSYVATKSKKICAYGDDAKRLCELKGSQYTLNQPIQGIDIVDKRLALALVNHIISDAIFENGKIEALVAVPCALTEKKLLELKMLLHKAGINKLNFVQNSVCVRAGLNVGEADKVMIVDMGKFLVDVSVLTRYEFIMGRNYLIGGSVMDEALATYIQDNYGVTINNQTAQTIKDEIASMHTNDMYTTTFVGVDENGEYKEVTMRANEVRVAIIGVYEKIFDLVDEVLEGLSVETLAEVRKNGIVFVGGVSSIDGLVEYTAKRFNMPTYVMNNPKDAVMLGAGKLLTLNKGDYPRINL